MPEELKVGLRGLNPEVNLAVPYQAHPSHIRMIEYFNEYILFPARLEPRGVY